MTRILVVTGATIWVAVGLLALSGCKGETVVKDNPETASALSDCRDKAQEKDNYIKKLEMRLAELELSGGELVVKIEGDEMVVSGASESARPGGGASAEQIKKLTGSFLAQVQNSRSAMKKCYQGALKKNTALQAKPVDLAIDVQFKSDGAVQRARFSPRLSVEFDACMTTIARRWTLPGAPTGVTFQQRVALSPQ